MTKNHTARLASLSVGDVGRDFDDQQKFIVTSWYGSDRVDGRVEIQYENGTVKAWNFDADSDTPMIIYLGKGKLESKIIMVEG